MQRRFAMASFFLGGRRSLLWGVGCGFLTAICVVVQTGTGWCADSEVTIDVQVVSTAATSTADSAPASSLPATHQQVKFITPAGANEKLASFCVTSDGRIVA